MPRRNASVARSATAGSSLLKRLAGLAILGVLIYFGYHR